MIKSTCHGKCSRNKRWPPRTLPRAEAKEVVPLAPSFKISVFVTLLGDRAAQRPAWT